MRKLWSFVSILVLLGSILPNWALAGPPDQGPQPQVDPQILADMAASPDGTAGFFVLFRKQADLSPAYHIHDWKGRGRYVYNALKTNAEVSQNRVRAWLDAHGIPYHPLIIDNSIFLTADKAVLEELATFPEVAGFRANRIHPLEPIRSESPQAFPQGIAWNIALVGADRAWEDYGAKGQGIVVANIDTGVEYTHDALFVNYKCGSGPHEDCWYDPSAVCSPSTVPCDNVGHGTHTMGTMVGDDNPALLYNVGMAPDAQWIACKGCEDFSCSDFALNACADWILAPNGNPDNRPHVVNNSWGGWGCDEFYRTKVQAWRAAGIFPAFSAGNSGPGCSSLGSPGDYPESFATGASDLNDDIAAFSSRGPSCWDEIKPEVVAPGVDVCSSVPGNGWDCSWSGTSMASPHTAGLVALLWSADPDLLGDISATEYLITSTAVCRTDLSCGGEDCHNNVYGWGRINAYDAVGLVATIGYLHGYVRDTNGAPLAGATIRGQRAGGGTFTKSTDPTGYYTMSLPAGLYTVTAALYGYLPETATGVEIITDQVTIRNFTLTSVPFYTVSGQVTDARAGWPLYARISVSGEPISPPPPYGRVWTDPLSGLYTISLAAGITYTFEVEPWAGRYLPESRQVGPLSGDETQDFAMMVDEESCSAPGYWPDMAYYEDFEGDDGDFKASGNTSWEWGIPTSGPGAAHSGIRAWATNLAGNYRDNEDGFLVSPEIDLSAYAGQAIYFSWWQWLQTEECCDFVRLEVSNDGGETWNTVYWAAGNVDSTWTRHFVFLSPAYATEQFRFRFYFYSDYSITYQGWYVDDIGFLPVPPTAVYTEDFEANNGGYTTSGTTSWEWGIPTSGPGSAHSGTNVWATNLEGNYGNNENGCVASPEIDLSAYGGQQFQLSWWQWLRTENLFDYASVQVSNDGGSTWSTVYGEVSGSVDPVWAQQTVALPPDYAVHNFRVRFCLRSDRSVTYPGYYVDDVTLAFIPPVEIPCDLLAGGLVLGHVYDDNSGVSLNDATVRNDSGYGTVTRATEDPDVGDGFYILFSPAGPHTFTATMAGGYGYDTETVTVSPSDTVRQDFYLPAGYLTTQPASLSVVIEMGMSTTVPLTLTNLGALPANFELRERSGGYVPQYLPPVVVPGYQSSQGSEESLYAKGHLVSRPAFLYQPPADARLQLGKVNVLLVAADDASQIRAILQAYPDIGSVDYFDARTATPSLDELLPYDAVIVLSNYPFADPEGMGNVLADYVDAGGKVVQTVPTFYDPYGYGWGLKGRFVDEGYSPFIGTGDWFSWANLGDFDPNHPIMAGVSQAGDALRQMVEMAEGAEWVASWEDDEFVATKGSVVALNTFIADGYAWTGDVPLIVHNSVFWLQTVGDVPWLSEQPVTGTVVPALDSVVEVTFDTGVPEVDQPGRYYATLQVKNDTPYGDVLIPVTMTVPAPANWGKMMGTVYSLGYCDVNTATLKQATVLIQATSGQTYTVETGADGRYLRWLEQGTYTVTVLARGHLSQTALLQVASGATTTHDFELRLFAPCLTISPALVEAWLLTGTQRVYTLLLTNSGAQDLIYQTLEISGAMAAGHGEILGQENRSGVEQLTNLGTTRTSTPVTYHYRSGNPAQYRVLLCTDSCALYPPNTCAEVALQNLGISYDLIYQDLYGCESAINSGNYDIVLVDNACFFPQAGLFDALDNFLQSGGRAIIDTFDMDAFATHPLWETAGVDFASDVAMSPPPPIYRWQPGHPVVQDWPADPLNFDDLYFDDGDKFDALPVASLLAGYTASAEDGQGGLALRWDNFAMVFGFCIDNLAYRDQDGDGIGDCAEVWQGAIHWLLYPGVDIPWLDISPVTGTVPAGTSLTVQVTVTAFPTMTVGNYMATLLLLNNDPVHGAALVPVLMHVASPQDLTIYLPLLFKSSSP